MATKEKKTGIIGPTIFAGFALGFVYLVFLLPDGPEECGSASSAYAMSQKPVSGALNSPSTAEFPSISAPDVSVTSDGECLYTVTAYVDAQNEFGATVRTPYTAKLVAEQGGNGWSVLGVELD